jgi:peptide/nickel transport system substrate-binding protein
MKTIVYKEVPASPQRVALVQGGDADVAQYLRPRELRLLSRTKGVRVDAIRGTQQTWIELNAKMKPFDSVQVRQAMNYAFPQDEVIRTVYQGYGQPLRTGIPTLYPAATEKFWTYRHDPEKAKALLRQGGHPDGFSATLSYNAGVPEQEEIATIYQTALRDVGVDLKLNKLPAGTFYDYVSKRSQAMIFYTDAPWNPDPGYANTLYFHSKSFVNYSNYVNKRVDTLIDRGLGMVDLKKRIPMYQQVQKIYMAEAPWVFIVRPAPALAVRDNVRGWVYYTSNNVRFQDFTKS